MFLLNSFYAIVDPKQLSEGFLNKRSSSGTSSVSDFLFSFGLLILITGAIFAFFFILKKVKETRLYRKDYETFIRLAEEKNLTYKQIKILENLARKYHFLPSQLLTSQKDLIAVSLKEMKFLLSQHPAKSPIIFDFENNINYIKSVFYKRKPKSGEMLNNSRDIHTGTSVIVFRKDKNGLYPAKGSIVYMDDNKFVVKIKTIEKNLAPLLKAEEVFIFFTHEADANYEFKTKIIDTKFEKTGLEDCALITFAHSDKLHRQQRRKFIRVRVNLPLAIHQAVFNETVKPMLIQGTMIDISEGGACFRSEDIVPLDSVVQLSFLLKDKEMKNILAKIVGVRKIENGHLHHLSFMELNDEQKITIRDFVSEHIERRV